MNRESLAGYSDLLYKFNSSNLSPKLLSDRSLSFAISALEEGLSVLASPMVDVEHAGRDLNVNILLWLQKLQGRKIFVFWNI